MRALVQYAPPTVSAGSDGGTIERVKQILSIQSAVAYGFAGNSAAVFPLRRAGLDVWPVLTVNFSNHSGYKAMRGPVIPADQVAEVVKGIDERGVLPGIDAVLTGYQGSPAIGTVILEAVALVKERNPAALYCADPVFGDVGRGIYVAEGIAEFMRDEVTPRADIMTPNLFELGFLTGLPTDTLGQTVEAARALRAMGPAVVLVTSVTDPSDSDDIIRMIALDQTCAYAVETPYIHRDAFGSGYVGSGDLTTAIFLAHLLKGESLAQALAGTASVVYSILKKTDDLGLLELALVQAQDDVVAPTYTFAATPID